MKTFKIIVNFIYAICIITLIVIGGATVFSVTQGPGGWHIFVVQSGSMEPAIKTGSMVFVVPRPNYQANDVITFFANSADTNLKKPNSTVTHRLVSLQEDPKTKVVTYQTKGDANNAPDKDPIHRGSILGKVIFIVPFLGYLVAFTKTQVGFILLIIMPSVLIIYGEIINIKKEVVAIFSRKHDQKS